MVLFEGVTKICFDETRGTNSAQIDFFDTPDFF